MQVVSEKGRQDQFVWISDFLPNEVAGPISELIDDAARHPGDSRCEETHFEPNGLKGRVMSVLMMKRKFRQVREAALSNLERLAEAQSDPYEQPLADAN